MPDIGQKEVIKIAVDLGEAYLYAVEHSSLMPLVRDTRIKLDAIDKLQTSDLKKHIQSFAAIHEALRKVAMSMLPGSEMGAKGMEAMLEVLKAHRPAPKRRTAMDVVISEIKLGD